MAKKWEELRGRFMARHQIKIPETTLLTGLEDIIRDVKDEELMMEFSQHLAEEHCELVSQGIRDMQAIANRYSDLVGQERVDHFIRVTRYGPNQQASENFYKVLQQNQQEYLQAFSLAIRMLGDDIIKDTLTGVAMGAIGGFVVGCLAGGAIGSGIGCGIGVVGGGAVTCAMLSNNVIEQYDDNLEIAGQLTLAMGEFKRAYLNSITPFLSEGSSQQKAKEHAEAMREQISGLRAKLENISPPQHEKMEDEEVLYQPPSIH